MAFVWEIVEPIFVKLRAAWFAMQIGGPGLFFSTLISAPCQRTTHSLSTKIQAHQLSGSIVGCGTYFRVNTSGIALFVGKRCISCGPSLWTSMEDGEHNFGLARIFFWHVIASHWMMQGPTLSNFPKPMQPQCSPEVKERMFPYIEEALVTPPPLQDAAHILLTWLHWCLKVG